MASKESGNVTAALLLPGAILLVVFEFLLWGLLDSGLGVIAGAVFGVLLGICSIQVCLKQIVRIIEHHLTSVDEKSLPMWQAAVRTLMESLCVAVLLFLIGFVPQECSAFVLLTFVSGQILVARLAAVEHDNFATATGAAIFTTASAVTVRQNTVLVAIVYWFAAAFDDVTVTAAELLLWLLASRLLQSMVILLIECFMSAPLAARMNATAQRKLSARINGSASFLILYGSAFLVLNVYRAEGFYHHAWWIVATIPGIGLGIRLVLEKAGRRFSAWLQKNQPRPGAPALMAFNAMRTGEALALVGGILISFALLKSDSMQQLLSGVPEHVAWGLALALFAFGYCLGDGLNDPTVESATTEPAPRYDIELLALAATTVLLFADNFSLMHAEVAIGVVAGVLLHGFVFPFTLAVPGTDSSNSERDRIVINIRRVHAFLALFFLQIGLCLGLSLLSVFAFTSAIFVMTAMDVFIAPGKNVEERFNQHSWLWLSLVAIAIASEIIRAFGGDGTAFYSGFGPLALWMADHLNIDWIRYLLGVAITIGGVGIGLLLHIRGMNYRLSKSDS